MLPRTSSLAHQQAHPQPMYETPSPGVFQTPPLMPPSPCKTHQTYRVCPFQIVSKQQQLEMAPGMPATLPLSPPPRSTSKMHLTLPQSTPVAVVDRQPRGSSLPKKELAARMAAPLPTRPQTKPVMPKTKKDTRPRGLDAMSLMSNASSAIDTYSQTSTLLASTLASPRTLKSPPMSPMSPMSPWSMTSFSESCKSISSSSFGSTISSSNTRSSDESSHPSSKMMLRASRSCDGNKRATNGSTRALAAAAAAAMIMVEACTCKLAYDAPTTRAYLQAKASPAQFDQMLRYGFTSCPCLHQHDDDNSQNDDKSRLTAEHKGQIDRHAVCPVHHSIAHQPHWTLRLTLTPFLDVHADLPPSP
ncbi:hypothetical protein BC940DRAFT_304638 [Gongronella butleri]|nr:hypothetical protein BC940DRAFT_304638 [Gongronella butleri]